MKDFNASNLRARLTAHGVDPIARGKVRTVHALPDHDDLLLMVSSDDVSIFDVRLGNGVPQKGEILTAMTVFWPTEVLKTSNHLVAYGAGIDKFLPTDELRGNTDLQKRGLVVKKLEIHAIECIVRGYLTGSGLKSYRKTGYLKACQQELPEGLHDGSAFDHPIFNPTTKEKDGHDQPLDDTVAVDKYGEWIRDRSIEIYQAAATFAMERGLIIADTKFEFGGNGALADEILTPDSSRYWQLSEWEKAQKEKTSPSSYDKQLIRNWGVKEGIDKLDPRDAADRLRALDFLIPSDLARQTQERYHKIFKQLTGLVLSEFQHEKMGIF